MIKFNIQEAARQVFNLPGYIFEAGNAAAEAALTVNHIAPIYPEALTQTTETAQDIYAINNRKSDQTGIAMFDKIDFAYTRDGDDVNIVNFRLPDSTIIHPTRTKKKVITELNGRDGAVTEITSNGVWKLRIYGFIINVERVNNVLVESNAYPLDKIKAMAETFEVGKSMRIISRLCEYLKIFHVNVDFIDFMPMPGFSNVAPFELHLTQDEPIELIINPPAV